jgi:hypothetical protein
MHAQSFARIAGIVYLVAAIAGFIPPLLTPDPTELHVEMLHGRLLGLFPVNILHSLVHLLIGVWGVLAARSFAASMRFCVGLAILYGLFTILGLIPALQSLFGLVPLYSHDVWLHALTALLAAWVALRNRRAAPLRT